MADLKVEVDPADVGFDGSRLGRIEQHFRSYVDDGRLAGWQIVVTRHGNIAYLANYGYRDRENELPVESDTIWRIFSMTKPVTSTAVMMLLERGALDLRDPVSDFIGSFADSQVYIGGTENQAQTEPAETPVRIWHLLTHTAGLSYGGGPHPVDATYRAAGLSFASDHLDLAQRAELWGAQPLLFHPGTSWNYSVATDVLGRVVEVASGQSFEDYLAENIFEPLQMTDTSFIVPEDKVDRLAAFYQRDRETNLAVPTDDARSPRATTFPSGGGGLLGTASDYHRFTQMLLGEGALDGVRILGPRTVQAMTSNALPGGNDLDALGRGASETRFEGMGFGYGFSVVLDPPRTRTFASLGEYAWGGLASTAFWVDPQERITALLFTQLRPSNAWPLRPRLRNLVYQALVDRT